MAAGWPGSERERGCCPRSSPIQYLGFEGTSIRTGTCSMGCGLAGIGAGADAMVMYSLRDAKS